MCFSSLVKQYFLKILPFVKLTNLFINSFFFHKINEFFKKSKTTIFGGLEINYFQLPYTGEDSEKSLETTLDSEKTILFLEEVNLRTRLLPEYNDNSQLTFLILYLFGSKMKTRKDRINTCIFATQVFFSIFDTLHLSDAN